MQIPEINYSRPVTGPTVGREQSPDLIQGPVRNFMQQSEITGQVAGMVTGAILKQAEDYSHGELVKYRVAIENSKNALLSGRTIDRSLVPDGVEIYGNDPQVSTSMYGVSAFDKQSKDIQDKFLETIPGSMQSKFQDAAESIRHQATGHVFATTQQWALDERKQKYQEGVNALIDAKLFDAAKDLTSAYTRDLGAGEVAKINRHITLQQVASPIKQAIMSEDRPAMQAQYSILASKHYDGPLSENDRMALMSSIEGKFNEIDAKEKKADAINNGSILSRLSVMVTDGERQKDGSIGFWGPAEIERTYAMNIGMSWEQKAALYRAYNARLAKDQADANLMGMAANAIANNTHLDHSNPGHQKAADLTFDAYNQARPGPENAIVNMTNTMSMGIIPTAVRGIIVTSNQADTPQEMAKGVVAMQLAKQYAPEHYASIPLEDRVALETYATMATSSPATAFATAKKIREQTPEAKALLGEMYHEVTAKLSKTNNADALAGAMKGDEEWNTRWHIPIVGWGVPFTSSSPDKINPLMQSQYNEQVKARFMHNGDLAAAQKGAWDDIKHEWGTFEGRMMQHPPAKVLGADDQLVREALNSFVSGLGFGARADGSRKGSGFLGVLRRPDGEVSSELSIGVNINGKETEIPTLVPTLTKDEVNVLLNLSDGSKIPEIIVEKAISHAKMRMASNQNVFANDGPNTPKPGDVRIVSTPYTKTTKEYALEFKNPEGVYYPLNNTSGRQITWKAGMDVSKLADEKHRVKNEAAAARAAAKPDYTAP